MQGSSFFLDWQPIMQPGIFFSFLPRSPHRLQWKLLPFSLLRAEGDLCEIEGMLETYHSNYKIDYFSIKLKVFSRCTTKSFFSFYKNSSFSSSLPLLSPSIHWNCTGQDTFLPSSAFQRCSICVCVGPRLWDVFSVSSSATKIHVRQVTGHGHSA